MTTNATANIPDPSGTNNSNDVKIATPDLILQNEEVMSIEIMTDLIFEDIGGYELATISRHDLVNGQKVIYTPIKNLTDLYLQYNPNNILSLQSSDSFLNPYHCQYLATYQSAVLDMIYPHPLATQMNKIRVSG